SQPGLTEEGVGVGAPHGRLAQLGGEPAPVPQLLEVRHQRRQSGLVNPVGVVHRIEFAVVRTRRRTHLTTAFILTPHACRDAGHGPRNLPVGRRFYCLKAVRARLVCHAGPRGPDSGDTTGYSVGTRPVVKAITTAWVRSRAPSLPSSPLTWVRTVSTPSTRCSAISAFVRPCAISPSTSDSRGVSAGPS